MKYSPSTKGFYEDWRASVPVDCINMPDDDWQALFQAQAEGALIVHDGINLPTAQYPPAPTQEQINDSIKQQISLEIQQRLDQFAQTRGYDNSLSCCTYATDPVQKFAQEGQYCVQARSITWSKLYQILAEVEQGTRPMPQSYQDIESELPQLQWPV